jgi:hypothetical protein
LRYRSIKRHIHARLPRNGLECFMCVAIKRYSKVDAVRRNTGIYPSLDGGFAAYMLTCCAKTKRSIGSGYVAPRTVDIVSLILCVTHQVNATRCIFTII